MHTRAFAFALVPLALVVGVFAYLLFQGETKMPGSFPVLSAEELSGAAPTDGTELATFGSGCFWCTEAVFQQLKGVKKVVSGYSGGAVKNPTYEQVCAGTTGHAEVIQVTFDPAVVSYAELLEVFWRSHDPTTRNRQGNDVGPQYRSVVFYHSERQRELAERYKQKIDDARVFAGPVVTEIAPYTEFFAAEGYHQNYYADNTRAPYCRAIIGPKLEKLKAVFKDRLKPE